MMNSRRILLSLFPVVVASSPLSVSAQTRGLHAEVTPVVGWFRPIENLRAVQEDSAVFWTRIAPARTLGIRVESDVPAIRFLALRGSILYTGSDLAVQRQSGRESCGEACFRTVYMDDPIAPGSLLTLSADLVLHGPRILRVQPRVLMGGGIKRYYFGQDALQGPYAAAFAADESARTFHLGFGADVNVARYGIVAEVGTYMNDFDQMSPVHSEPGYTLPRDFGEIQMDVFMTIGVRFRPFN